MDWYLTQKGAQSPQKTSMQTPIGCLSWRESSQSMVQLHSFISIYNVETMLGSRFIFNSGNTHNRLISDPKGCSEPPKQAYQHRLSACRDVKLSQSMVELHSVMSTYNVETMLGSRFIFNSGNTHNGLTFGTKKGDQSPQNKHVYTDWRPVMTWNWARAWWNYILSCLYII